MKWKELTPEERDRLVAESVMNWQAKECDGEIGELPNSSDGWFCQKCGEEGCWGDDMTHEERPRCYSQSIGRAWDIVTLPALKLVQIEFLGNFYTVALAPKDGLTYPVKRYYGGSANIAEAICMAALKWKGVEITFER